MTGGVRELFPFGDIDDDVVRAMAERFPGLPADEVAAALALGGVVVELLERLPAPIYEEGLSPARWRLLVALVAQAGPDGARMGELASHLGVREPTMTATVNRAQTDGLVSRTRDPGDRRSMVVRITPKGRDLVGRLVPRIAARLVGFVAALGGPSGTHEMAERIGHAISAGLRDPAAGYLPEGDGSKEQET